MIKKYIVIVLFLLISLFASLNVYAEEYTVNFRRGAPVSLEIPAIWKVSHNIGGFYLEYKKSANCVIQICIMTDSRPYKDEQSIKDLVEEYLAILKKFTPKSVNIEVTPLVYSALDCLPEVKLYSLKYVIPSPPKVTSINYFPHDKDTIYPVQVSERNPDKEMLEAYKTIFPVIIKTIINK